MVWAPLSTDERRDVRLTAEAEASLSSPSAPSSVASLGYQVINPNGDVATSVYDDAGRIDTLVTANGSTTVSSYDYGYDTNGNRTSQVEILRRVAECAPSCGPVEATPELTTYAYDAANRLKRVTYSADASYPQGRVATYTYDKAGNREGERETTISTVPPTTEFPNPEGSVIIERIGAFDANNRLSSLSSSGVSSTIGEDTRLASYAFTYDNNGNEVQRISTTQHTPDPQGEPRPATVVTTNSIYDLSDRLVEQERGGAIIARHEYDGEGRRTKKIGEDGIRQYVYDDTSILAEYDTNGLEIAKYDYGADRLIRLTRADEGTRYFSFDGLGSVTSLTTLSGTVAASYRIDAWGQFRFEAELAPSKNRFGFTGHYWDKESSLYYAKARYYDPFTARFTQADSFLGTIDDPPSLHRYFYAAANPTFFVDLDGHALTEAQKREFFAQMKGNLQGVNNLANQVAKPIVEREQGLFEFLLPGGFGRLAGQGNSETNTTRNYQGHMLDGRQSAGGLQRTADYATSLLLQPLAMLEDVGRAIASVPGRLARAVDSLGSVSSEDSFAGKAYQLTSAVQDVANSAEIGVGSYFGAKGGAVVVTEARSAAASARGSIQRFSDGLPGRNLLNGEIVMSPGGPLMASLPTIRPRGLAISDDLGPAPEGVVYLRNDRGRGLQPYGGQAKSETRFVERQSEHARDHPDADFEFTIVSRAEPGIALDIAEHKFIQELTGGVAARKSLLVSNAKDPVGRQRRAAAGLPEPRKPD